MRMTAIRRQTTSRVETLEDELERRVLEGRFKPGEHLGEIALAEEFDVGRNTLRAAFDGLAGRGLLVKSRNRGVFVRALTAHDLADCGPPSKYRRRACSPRAGLSLPAPGPHSRSTTASALTPHGASSWRLISPSIARSSSGRGTRD